MFPNQPAKCSLQPQSERASASARLVREVSRIALAGKDGRVVVFEVYMDETGTHAGSPIVAVAAYIGRPEVWARWTEKWTEALGSIGVYHAVDAQNLSGEFEGWTADQVGALAAKLLPITAKGGVAAVAVAMDLRIFDAAMAGRPDLLELFGTPYIACFQWAAQIILNIAHKGGNIEPIAFIHENNDYHGQAYEAFDWIKKNRPDGASVVSLTFGSKKDYPPLQTADILAYETNKRLRNVGAAPRRPWEALRANTFAVQYGSDNMAELIDTLEKIRGRTVGPDHSGFGLEPRLGEAVTLSNARSKSAGSSDASTFSAASRNR